jgi:hypothetical protein
MICQYVKIKLFDNYIIYEKVVKILKTYWLYQIVNYTTYEAHNNFNFGGNQPNVPLAVSTLAKR